MESHRLHLQVVGSNLLHQLATSPPMAADAVHTRAPKLQTTCTRHASTASTVATAFCSSGQRSVL